MRPESIYIMPFKPQSKQVQSQEDECKHGRLNNTQADAPSWINHFFFHKGLYFPGPEEGPALEAGGGVGGAAFDLDVSAAMRRRGAPSGFASAVVAVRIRLRNP